MSAVKLRPARRPAAPRTRRERADATRLRIITAAAQLFRDRGYAATTMEAIARSADVAVQTVYFTFHTKTELLSAVADFAITGDAGTEPERAAWARAVMEERNARRRIARVVDSVGEIAPRMLPIASAWRAAMSADPSAGRRYRERLLSRRAYLRKVVELTRERGELRADLDPERATDLFFALTTPELFETLVQLLGWDVSQWRRWVVVTLERELLT
jgi:TetR/AcrR family transcriptional regulator of autoinduction and epiphytic fitness